MAAKKAKRQGDGFDLIRPECMENANEINFRKRPYLKKNDTGGEKEGYILEYYHMRYFSGYFG